MHYHPTTGQVLRLIGAGLVHRPNLALTALSEQEFPMTDAPARSDLSRIAAALGLDDAADTASILTAINAQSAPDPARYVPIAAVADLLHQRNAAARDGAARTAEARVNRAVEDGYLTPAMREWAVALCTRDEASFDQFLAKGGPSYAHMTRLSGLDNASLRARSHHPASADEQAICAQLGLSPDDLR